MGCKHGTEGACTRCHEAETLADLRARAESAEAERDRLKTLGEKVNAIRNSIIGFQRMGFSEHVYPLVAALDEAGFEGLTYEQARANVGTLIEQTKAAEAERDRYRDALIACREPVWRSLHLYCMTSPTDESRQLSALLDTIDAAAKGNIRRCGYCDDTGDVHSPDGQWRGACSCPAGAAAKGQG